MFVGRYYLVDSGFAFHEGYVAPYGLKNGIGSGGVEDTFNLHHSRLRSVVERTFSALKKRWEILEHVPLYSREKQTKIVLACCALHNFVEDRKLELQLLMEENINADYNFFHWSSLSNIKIAQDAIAWGLQLHSY